MRRRLHLGAVAIAYARVLKKRDLRVAALDGYKMCVNVAEHSGIHSFFFRDALVAWPTRRLVPPGGVCVDIGGNAGIYTFLFGSLVGPNGRVFTFEPNPDYSSMIERSIALNGWEDRVSVDHRAVADSAGQRVRFFLSTNLSNSGTSSLVNHGVFLDEGHAIEVETVTLDEFAREAGIEHASVVKIDVERSEDRVLRGAGALLGASRVDYLIVEMLAGGDAQRTVASYGYSWYLIDDRLNELVPVEQVPEGHFGDYLAVSPSARSAFERRFGRPSA